MSGPICASKSWGCGFVDSRAVTSVAVMVAVFGAGSTGRSNCTSSDARKEVGSEAWCGVKVAKRPLSLPIRVFAAQPAFRPARRDKVIGQPNCVEATDLSFFSRGPSS
jgi:hypothetical protein